MVRPHSPHPRPNASSPRANLPRDVVSRSSRCSLLAHEHCLLVWIASKQEHTSVVKCPQCREPYRVEEVRPFGLSRAHPGPSKAIADPLSSNEQAPNYLYQALDVGDRISHRICIWSYELGLTIRPSHLRLWQTLIFVCRHDLHQPSRSRQGSGSRCCEGFWDLR